MFHITLPEPSILAVDEVAVGDAWQFEIHTWTYIHTSKSGFHTEFFVGE